MTNVCDILMFNQLVLGQTKLEGGCLMEIKLRIPITMVVLFNPMKQPGFSSYIEALWLL